MTSCFCYRCFFLSVCGEASVQVRLTQTFQRVAWRAFLFLHPAAENTKNAAAIFIHLTVTQTDWSHTHGPVIICVRWCFRVLTCAVRLFSCWVNLLCCSSPSPSAASLCSSPPFSHMYNNCKKYNHRILHDVWESCTNKDSFNLKHLRYTFHPSPISIHISSLLISYYKALISALIILTYFTAYW